MAVDDLWYGRDGEPTARHGRGKRYRVRVKGHPTRSYSGKNAAKAWEARLLATPVGPARSTITVGELLDAWLEAKRGLSGNGYLACKNAADHVRARWADVEVQAVRADEVAVWLAGLQVRDNTAPRKDHALKSASNSTRAKVLQAMSGACRMAISRGVLSRNPCDGISAGRQARRPVEFLSAVELAMLAKAAGSYAPMVWLLGMTGLRIGECVALNIGDVDTARRRLLVRKSKTSQPREVPVPARVVAMLDVDRPRGAPLFVTASGTRVLADNFRHRVLAPAAREIGRPDVTPHVLRHTAASLAIASGADVKAIQRMLGHETAALTLDTYGHLWDAGLDAVASRMDTLVET